MAPTPKDRLRLWLTLLRAQRRIEGEIRERLRLAFAVTLPQFDVMAALDRLEGGANMSEISRWLMVSNGNVTGIVDRLVADGIAIRVQDTDDRRRSFVRLTAKGRKAFARMAAAHEGWIDELLGGFDGADVQGLASRLGRIVRETDGGPRHRRPPRRKEA